jgi:PAS domain S-box-containing protein
MGTKATTRLQNRELPAGDTLIWLGVVAGLGFYVADAFIDVFILGEGNLVDQLLHPSWIELWMRASVLLICVVFAGYANVIFRRERVNARRAQTAEQFLNCVVDNIPDMVFIKDAKELRFVRVNTAAEKLVGHTQAELLGRTDHDFFPRPQADFFTQKDREVLASGAPLDVAEEEIDTAHLGQRVLHTKKVPILDETGRPAFLLGISEDITERKQAETDVITEKTRAERYLQISRAMIVGLDRSGRVELINHRGCELLGYSEAEILGRNWFQTVLPETQRAEVYQVFQQIVAGEFEPMRYYENEVLTKSGELRYIAWNNTVQEDSSGAIVGTLSSGQDITERRRAEIAAKRHQQELAHVMRLSTMGEMASGLAHELNQPLTAVTTYCETALAILESQVASPPEEVGAILERAAEQARRAGKIIRHLRDFVRKGETPKGPVELDAVIRDALNLLEWELRNGEVVFQLRLGGRGHKIWADRVQIEQVVLNLVRNSLEAIHGAAIPDGRIMVETRPMQDERLEVTVTDNGTGIDAAMVNKLFDPFQTTKATGIGIGLSISRSIIAAHGGKLWAKQAPQTGAVFGFELPIWKS